MKKRLFIFFAGLLIVFIISQEVHVQEFFKSYRNEIVEVPMVRLLALPFPNRYYGKTVIVTGFYYSSGSESSELYLNREDARIRNKINSFLIISLKDDKKRIPYDQMHNHYITICGEYRGYSVGADKVGEINNILYIDVFYEKTYMWV